VVAVEVLKRLDNRVPPAAGAAPAGTVTIAVHRGMPLPMITILDVVDTLIEAMG